MVERSSTIRWTRTLLLCLAVSIAPALHADTGHGSQGHELARLCMSDGIYEVFGCEMYLEGAWDALRLAGVPACFDGERPSAAQLRRAVLRFIETHPQQQHQPRIELVEASFRQAWPCPQAADLDPRLSD